MKILGIQCYQDYNVCLYDTDTQELKYLEIEKLVKKKHFSFHSDKLDIYPEVDNIYRDNMRNNIFKVQKLIKKQFNVEKFDWIAWCYTQFEDGYLKKESYEFVKTLEKCPILLFHHQENHVLPTVIFNKLQDAVCLSVDGKGDGNHAVYLYEKNDLKKLFQEQKFSYGMFYEVLASNFLKEKYYDGMEGKFMAFAGVKPIFVDIPNIKQFMNYVKSVDWNSWDEKSKIEKYINDYINKLKSKCDEYELAYTFQKIWIDDLLDFIEPYKQYSDNLVFSGGCSLNCLLNYELVKSGWFKNIYWNPVSSDTGQSLGALISMLFYDKFGDGVPKINNYYITSGIYDKAYYTNNIYPKLSMLDNKVVVQKLLQDNIIGVCRGNIEMGPRALGHRSILAPANKKSMHNRLNGIKNREWYRPFGIIIPRECVDTYFDINVDAPYMNVLGRLNKLNNDSLVSGAMHLDGTVRIQTVSEQDDKWLHDLLIEYGKQSGAPILINTSFNDNGMPIFNYSKDVYRMFKEKLDGLIFEDGMIFK